MNRITWIILVAAFIFSSCEKNDNNDNNEKEGDFKLIAKTHIENSGDTTIHYNYEYNSNKDLVYQEYHDNLWFGYREYEYNSSNKLEVVKAFSEYEGSNEDFACVGTKYIYKKCSYPSISTKVDTVFDCDGSWRYVLKSEYNLDGSIAKATYEFTDSRISYTDYIYFENGNLKEETTIHHDGQQISKMEYLYDEYSNVIKTRHTTDATTHELTYENDYNSKNELIKVSTYDESGYLQSVNEYEFDNYGNIIIERLYGGSNYLRSTIYYNWLAF